MQDFLSAIVNLVPSTGEPLVLVAFLFTTLMTSLLIVMKYTSGLQKAQDLFEKWLSRKEFLVIFRWVILSALFSFGLVFVLLVFSMSQNEASTQELCYDKTCWNRDPKDNMCNLDAITITSSITSFRSYGDEFVGTPINLRYSNRCNASWVQGTGPVGSRIYIETKEGDTFGNTVPDDDVVEQMYTDMGPATIERRACIAPPNGEQPQCTNFVK